MMAEAKVGPSSAAGQIPAGGRDEARGHSPGAQWPPRTSGFCVRGKGAEAATDGEVTEVRETWRQSWRDPPRAEPPRV